MSRAPTSSRGTVTSGWLTRNVDNIFANSDIFSVKMMLRAMGLSMLSIRSSNQVWETVKVLHIVEQQVAKVSKVVRVVLVMVVVVLLMLVIMVVIMVMVLLVLVIMVLVVVNFEVVVEGKKKKIVPYLNRMMNTAALLRNKVNDVNNSLKY